MFYDLKNYHKIRDIKRLVSDDQEKSAIIRLKKIFCTHIKKSWCTVQYRYLQSTWFQIHYVDISRQFFKQQKFFVVYFNITGKYDFLALQLPVDQVVHLIYFQIRRYRPGAIWWEHQFLTKLVCYHWQPWTCTPWFIL